MVFNINDKFEKSFKVSNKTYQGFIKLSKDTNPLHINEEFAISKGFRSIVMHGNILNVFLSYFIGECMPCKNVMIYSQEIEFKNPIYLNDKLNFNASVSGIFESVNVVELKYYFKNLESQIIAKGKIKIGIL
jgi:3-hydroxybutyryl-CoA dehydratase